MDLAKVNALCPGPEELVRTFPQSCATDPMAPCCVSDDHSCAAGQGPLCADWLQAGVLDTGCGSAVLCSFVSSLYDHRSPEQAPCLLPALSTPSSLSSLSWELRPQLQLYLGVTLTDPTPITHRLCVFDLFLFNGIKVRKQSRLLSQECL